VTERTRPIGDRRVFAVALGSAAFSLGDHPAYGGLRPPDEEQGIRAIHAALDAGITLIDTARAYTTAGHPGHSEALVGRALATHPRGSQALVATKGGYARNGHLRVDAGRDAIRRHCELSLELLGVDRIELYQLHHPDPEVPMADAMATFVELREEGLVRQVGLCNVARAHLDEALAVVPVASVQNPFSPLFQDHRELVDYCAERSIAFLAYSPLAGGSGLLGGHVRLAEAFPAAAHAAERRGVSIQRLALAWLLGLSPTLIPISGATRPETVRDSALAATLELDGEELDFDRPGAGAARVRADVELRLKQISTALRGG
jgi:aryl-alcohol dehydrogenase-like predicted oxidoreductase